MRSPAQTSCCEDYRFQTQMPSRSYQGNRWIDRGKYGSSTNCPQTTPVWRWLSSFPPGTCDTSHRIPRGRTRRSSGRQPPSRIILALTIVVVANPGVHHCAAPPPRIASSGGAQDSSSVWDASHEARLTMTSSFTADLISLARHLPPVAVVMLGWTPRAPISLRRYVARARPALSLAQRLFSLCTPCPPLVVKVKAKGPALLRVLASRAATMGIHGPSRPSSQLACPYTMPSGLSPLSSLRSLATRAYTSGRCSPLPRESYRTL
jgi:hypothetical protein